MLAHHCWRADHTCVLRNGEQILERIIVAHQDMSLPVDHLRESSLVVIDVLRFIGTHQRQPHATKQQSRLQSPEI
jgi:hypothetical protein